MHSVPLNEFNSDGGRAGGENSTMKKGAQILHITFALSRSFVAVKYRPKGVTDTKLGRG
jgi:hypothetical protein